MGKGRSIYTCGFCPYSLPLYLYAQIPQSATQRALKTYYCYYCSPHYRHSFSLSLYNNPSLLIILFKYSLSTYLKYLSIAHLVVLYHILYFCPTKFAFFTSPKSLCLTLHNLFSLTHIFLPPFHWQIGHCFSSKLSPPPHNRLSQVYSHFCFPIT